MYSIIANEQDFIVVNKWPDVSFHTETTDEGLVILGLAQQLNADLKDESLLPVHRLDKATSGLLVFAKNKHTCQALCLAFAEKKIGKYYLALSTSKPKKKQGLIMGDMEKARRGSWKLSTSQNNPAITQFFSYSLAPNKRLFLLKPHTGKTHQLRVAMKSIGAPILGDRRYGRADQDSSRLYLHAYQLYFTLQGVDYTYESMPEQGEFAGVSEFMHDQSIIPKQLAWPKITNTFK